MHNHYDRKFLNFMVIKHLLLSCYIATTLFSTFLLGTGIKASSTLHSIIVSSSLACVTPIPMVVGTSYVYLPALALGWGNA